MCLFTERAVVGISARPQWALPQRSGEDQSLQLLPALIHISHSAVLKKKIEIKTDNHLYIVSVFALSNDR